MDSGPICQRMIRKVVVTLATGSMAFGVASGCDPEVRDTILGGFQSLTETFVEAFFLNLADDEEAVTVRATVEDVRLA
jgi:hypothetical protein